MKDLLTHGTESVQNVVLGLSETWLTASVGDGVVSVDGYKTYRRDRAGKAGGGVLIFVPSSIKSVRKRDLEADDIELIWVEVRAAGKCYLVGSVYRPPRSPNEWMDSLHRVLDLALCEEADVILLGDFNCNLLKQDSCAAPLCSMLSELNLSQLIEEATRVTQTLSSLIDHLYTSNPDLFTRSGCCCTGISDHDIIYGLM